MLLALFARQRQRFGSCEERDHSSVERNWDPSHLWRGRKSGRRPGAERERAQERDRKIVSEGGRETGTKSETGKSPKVCGHQNK